MSEKAELGRNQVQELSPSKPEAEELAPIQREYLQELGSQARSGSGSSPGSVLRRSENESGSGTISSADSHAIGAQTKDSGAGLQAARSFPWTRPDYLNKDGSVIESEKALDTYARSIVDSLSNEKSLDSLRSLMASTHNFSEPALRRIVDAVNHGLEMNGINRRLDLTQTVLTSQLFIGGPSVAIFSNALVLREGARTIAHLESMPGFQSLKTR